MGSGFVGRLTMPPVALKAQLDACKQAFDDSAAPNIVTALRQSIEELASSGLVARAVKAGEAAPLFRLKTNNGDPISLSETLNRGPAIVSFFRGVWCPFCRLELQALAEAQSEIERIGATLIGLSPLPDPDSALGFPILEDRGCRIAARYRIAFAVAPPFRPAYRALGYPERSKGARDRWVLPLPATYIIGQNGIVAFSYVDADYTTRLEPSEIAVAAMHLRTKANLGSSM